MKRRTLTFGCIMLLLALATASASEPARTFMDGTEAYRNGDWPAAIAAFESLADGGVDNGRLFYNLGNAHLKNDDLGHALLWYERALQHIPDDPDLRFNHDYALTLTKDERGERESPLLRILFFWKYQLSHATVRWTAILLNAALWTALSVLAARKKRLLRPSVILTAAATIVFSATAAYNYVEARQVRYAVILTEQTAVRSGFSDTATQLFILHAGTRVRVERQTDTHLLVRYTEDKIGWVRQTDAGII
ncbi:BatE protein [Desulfosarcina alkanivorans]|uniref:BatE protein n=1 Tax=Desulfosarcina alkanivorans TaxID=571177 RepID=A0A5K7YUF0_9BACT|nr:tetratricopeptide repeat protein [Desulfosarcina alkanivorans]BBO69914.1 BatE protein [Desulfosarcina alkanivorans]